MSILFLATSNRHKIEELKALLADLPVDLTSTLELTGIDVPAEDGATFAANARLKALHYASVTGLAALADDSGLEVDALDGRPGVESARYAGAGASDQENRDKLLAELAAVPRAARTARFRCVVAVAHRGAVVLQADGSVEGEILAAERGAGGFGYDPLFFYPPLAKTFAELSPSDKNAVSHRARALRALAAPLRQYLSQPDDRT
ncbi:MAG: XTP/dITP diphosphatase [Planctomycetota bacterium]